MEGHTSEPGKCQPATILAYTALPPGQGIDADHPFENEIVQHVARPSQLINRPLYLDHDIDREIGEITSANWSDITHSVVLGVNITDPDLIHRIRDGTFTHTGASFNIVNPDDGDLAQDPEITEISITSAKPPLQSTTRVKYKGDLDAYAQLLACLPLDRVDYLTSIMEATPNTTSATPAADAAAAGSAADTGSAAPPQDAAAPKDPSQPSANGETNAKRAKAAEPEAPKADADIELPVAKVREEIANLKALMPSLDPKGQAAARNTLNVLSTYAAQLRKKYLDTAKDRAAFEKVQRQFHIERSRADSIDEIRKSLPPHLRTIAENMLKQENDLAGFKAAKRMAIAMAQESSSTAAVQNNAAATHAARAITSLDAAYKNPITPAGAAPNVLDLTDPGLIQQAMEFDMGI